MATHQIQTLDLHFQGLPHAIASYLVPHAKGAVLVEAGPGSTIGALTTGLKNFGLEPRDVTDVLLTHIHLDHAGAAGWLARQGARIFVHANGAPHLANPEKLIKSATRIYGDKMDTLWGEFLPVPLESMVIPRDGEEIRIGELHFVAFDTPGHADHHFAYRLEDICFTGDVAGVRLPGPAHLCVPMPPPEFHLEKWRATLARLREEKFERLALTHFGIFNDAQEHFSMLEHGLDDVEAFLLEVMPGNPSVEEVNRRFMEWTQKRSEKSGLSRELIEAYEAANPTWMSAAGMERYWRKYRGAPSSGGV